MQRKYHVARDEVELTALSEAEIRELLREGFLLPSDRYWADGMQDWEELSTLEAKAQLQSRSTALLEMARQKVSSTSQAAAVRVSRLSDRLKSLAAQGKGELADSTSRLLDAFTPQIQKLVEHQLVKQSVTRTQAALRDDEFMRKVFGATYDCLPKPVYRFVKEEDFIGYCMQQRGKLLGLEKLDASPRAAITSQPQSASDP